jgi:hypothetical protein
MVMIYEEGSTTIINVLFYLGRSGFCREAAWSRPYQKLTRNVKKKMYVSFLQGTIAMKKKIA